MIDLVYIALSSTLVPVLRVRGHYGYTDTKNQAFLVLSFLHLAACLLWEGRLPFPSGPAATALLGYLLFLTLSCAWSDNVEDSIRDLPRWWALFYFFLVCRRTPLLFVCEAVFLPSAFVASYGLAQQWFKFEPFWKHLRETKRVWRKGSRLYSWLGNTNYTGAYLVPCFFAGLYLVMCSSFWWILGLVPVWLAIGWSYCRASWAGVTIGLIVLNFMLASDMLRALILIGGLTVFGILGIISLERIESTMGRWYYIRTCIRLLMKRPLFGQGPRVFRRQYFNVQAAMNEEDPRILGDLKTQGLNIFPIGKRAHSDHFETLAESGILGYALFAIFYLSVLWAAGNAILAAGVVAGLVNALFFYNLRTGATALPFFALCGVLTPADAAAVVPLHFAVPTLLVLGYLVYRFTWIPYKAGLLFWDAQGTKNKKTAREKMAEALRLDPNNNMYLAFDAVLQMPENPQTALTSTLRAIHHDDGQKVAWAMWDQLGRMSFMNNAFYLARHAFRTAIRLNPSFPQPYEGLRETEKYIHAIEQHMAAQAPKQGEAKK